MTNHFETMLSTISHDPNIPISQVNILPQSERALLLHDFNNTKKDYPFEKTIIQWFEEQVEKTPNNVAINFQGQKTTYQELNERANNLGHFLRNEFEIQPNDIIAIQQEPHPSLIISILGILKSGAAYLPISPDLPQGRMAYMLEDSQAKMLLTDEHTFSLEKKAAFPIPILNMNNIAFTKKGNLAHYSTKDDLAYVIYTSGSTGKPKGVAIPIASMTNYLVWANEFYFKNSSNYGMPLHASIAFDMSITTLFSPILRGATMTIFPNQEPSISLKNIFISSTNIKAVKLTPGHIDMLGFLKLTSTNVEKVIVGGEALQPSQVQTLFNLNPNIKIYNEYGPTETTVGCSIQVIENSNEEITIGRPIFNTEVFILDKNKTITPIGVSGEIYISGSGLAKGYLNNSELTKKKFIPHPFKKGERIYQTGDLGKWRVDGQIEFLGRIDHQLKIRGYRIETGEIETTLLQHKDIQNVIVIGKSMQQGKELVAYLVTKKKSTLDAQIIKSFLKGHLPSYMIPSFFIFLEKLPLTSGGKVNRKALPDPQMTTSTYRAPSSNTETKLLKIWKSILNFQEFGVNENFFEIGGNSLKVIQLVSKMEHQFGLQIPVQMIFKYPTIIDQAAQIETLKNYNDKFIHKDGLRFNPTSNKTVFAFPGLMGLAIGFQQLAAHMPDYSFYCFDFIADENRLALYYEQIKQQQPNGSYTLLGYSAGGGLAYEMAAFMEGKGDHIEQVILGDCVVWESVKKESFHFDFDEYMKKTACLLTDQEDKFTLSQFGIMKEKEIQNQAKERMQAYYNFLNHIKMDKVIDADIFQLLVDESLNPYAKVFSYDWSQFTNGKFLTHAAHGTHEALFQSPSLIFNSSILEKILSRRTSIRVLRDE